MNGPSESWYHFEGFIKKKCTPKKFCFNVIKGIKLIFSPMQQHMESHDQFLIIHNMWCLYVH